MIVATLTKNNIPVSYTVKTDRDKSMPFGNSEWEDGIIWNPRVPKMLESVIGVPIGHLVGDWG